MSEESTSEDPKQRGAKLSLDLQHQPHSMEVCLTSMEDHPSIHESERHLQSTLSNFD